MKKLFLSGTCFIIYLVVLGSTLLINNTVNEQIDFTKKPIIDENISSVIETRPISYKEIIPEKHNKAATKTVSKTVNLEE